MGLMMDYVSEVSPWMVAIKRLIQESRTISPPCSPTIPVDKNPCISTDPAVLLPMVDTLIPSVVNNAATTPVTMAAVDNNFKTKNEVASVVENTNTSDHTNDLDSNTFSINQIVNDISTGTISHEKMTFTEGETNDMTEPSKSIDMNNEYTDGDDNPTDNSTTDNINQ